MRTLGGFPNSHKVPIFKPKFVVGAIWLSNSSALGRLSLGACKGSIYFTQSHTHLSIRLNIVHKSHHHTVYTPQLHNLVPPPSQMDYLEYTLANLLKVLRFNIKGTVLTRYKTRQNKMT